MSEKEPITSIRPSRSERPGFNQALATLMVDPAYWVFRGIAAIAEGITRAVLAWRDKRNAEKLQKAEKADNDKITTKRERPRKK